MWLFIWNQNYTKSKGAKCSTTTCDQQLLSVSPHESEHFPHCTKFYRSRPTKLSPAAECSPSLRGPSLQQHTVRSAFPSHIHVTIYVIFSWTLGLCQSSPGHTASFPKSRQTPELVLTVLGGSKHHLTKRRRRPQEFLRAVWNRSPSWLLGKLLMTTSPFPSRSCYHHISNVTGKSRSTRFKKPPSLTSL